MERNRNRGGYKMHNLRVGVVYLTCTSLCMHDFINMQSDWSRTKSPGGGAVPIKESVATENASRPTQKTKGEMLPDFSTQLWLYCTRLLLKRHQKQVLLHRANPKTAGFIPSPSHFNFVSALPGPHFLQCHQ